MPIIFGRTFRSVVAKRQQGTDGVGEVLLNADADVPSRGPAPFRHVNWRERDIAMVRLTGGTIRTRSRIPLTPSHNEITDKGCINQFAGPTRRAAVVERLYEDPVASDVTVPRWANP
jgi:hypothetical protein